MKTHHKKVDSARVLEFFNENKRLAKAALPDEVLYWFQEGCWNPGDSWIEVFVDGESVGLFNIQDFTNMMISCHIYCRMKFWGKPQTEQMGLYLINYLNDNTTYTSIFLTAPDPCVASQSYIKRMGGVLQGYLPASIMWRGKLTGLQMFGLMLPKMLGENNG